MKPIKIADRYKKSHLAKVVVAGLQEFQAHQSSTEISGEEIEASQPRSRALRSHRARRTEARRQRSGDHRFHGAVRRSVRYRRRHHQRVQDDCRRRRRTGIGAIAGGISEALVTTAIGLFVAVPAVWAFNYFTGRIDAFDVEMGNSSSELIDYFLKRSRSAAPARK